MMGAGTGTFSAALTLQFIPAALYLGLWTVAIGLQCGIVVVGARVTVLDSGMLRQVGLSAAVYRTHVGVNPQPAQKLYRSGDRSNHLCIRVPRRMTPLS